MESLTTSLTQGTNLTEAQIAEAAACLVDPAVTAMTKADFLRALAHKGETPEEIAAFVNEFLKRAVDPGIDRVKLPGPMLDVVGTGGDKLHLFNVSSTAMFILAAGGVCVTKHGNRGITSKAGGADVLEALGIKIDLPKEKSSRASRASVWASFSRRCIIRRSRRWQRRGRCSLRRDSARFSTCWDLF